MRYLSAHNKQLSEEITNLKTRLLGDAENLRDTYEKEMRQLRQMLDDAEREKADSHARLLTSQQTNRNQADQINRLQAENEKVSRKLEQAFDDMNKRDGDLAMLQRRLEAMDEELAKDRQASERVRRENESLMQVKFHFLAHHIVPGLADATTVHSMSDPCLKVLQKIISVIVIKAS
ncbi:unnamed protein product [Dibothriocephalus latus]|uniref:Uncharacterized protein n=1 Tax=Dibothriocephalus latus TaxID=60516 RepID=A0A3P7PCZ8_DIBLA|nr:unnamed protein product [Dibothriocephalus latus]